MNFNDFTRPEGWIFRMKKELSFKQKLEMRKKRREWLEVWKIKMGQLERVYSEQMGNLK